MSKFTSLPPPSHGVLSHSALPRRSQPFHPEITSSSCRGQESETEDTPPDKAAAEGAEHTWWLPHLVLFCCQCTFAVMHITSHGALDFIPPLPYSAMRVTLALPLLFAGARIKVRTQPAALRRRGHLARLRLCSCDARVPAPSDSAAQMEAARVQHSARVRWCRSRSTAPAGAMCLGSSCLS